MKLLPAAVHESGIGTNAKRRDVRYGAAIGGKAEVTRTYQTDAIDPTRTLQSLAWSNCLLRPRPRSFVGLSSIRVRDVSVLEVRIVAGRSSTLVSNQARCIQVAA